MDAQDIIELIEYFRNLQDTEMKFEIEELRGYIDIRFEELYDKLTEYIDFNRTDSNHPIGQRNNTTKIIAPPVEPHVRVSYTALHLYRI